MSQRDRGGAHTHGTPTTPSRPMPRHYTRPMPLTLSTTPPIAVADGADRLDAPFVADLAAICAEVAETPEIRALILDPEPALWRGWSGDDPAPGDLFRSLAELPQPTIAVLRGDCLGGGLELALAADIRIGAPQIELGFPELLDPQGEFCRAGGLQRLSRAVGRSRAGQLVLLEQRLPAECALDWGLLNQVEDDPSAAARALAETVAQRGPIAARYAKDAIRNGADMPLAQALHYETELTILLQSTADRAEGVAAFTQKRPPRFHGA